MKCDCIKGIEERLAKRFSEQAGAEIKVECQNMALMLEPAVSSQPYLIFKATGAAKGFARGKDQTVIANYCPFCGKSAKGDEEATKHEG
jgi:hypothetical protein